MELTEKQKQGLDIAIKRFENNEKYTVISGYAGTGKSTLVKFIVSALPGIDPDTDVVYTSFTGKATQVLAKKGNKNTSTLHKLLFESHLRADGTFYRVPVATLYPYKVVIVDEISMVPKELMDRLESYPVYIICLGDPFQLPPIDKDSDNHLLDHPHIFLDEIMRQAAESEIIQLTMKIRNFEPIDYFKGKEIQVLHKNELSTGMLLWADQILVATNATRKSINIQMRNLLGHGEEPEDGDKMICCRNYWDCEADNEYPLINGTIGTLKDSYKNFIPIPAYLRRRIPFKEEKIETINAYFIGDSEEDYGLLRMDRKLIEKGVKTLDYKSSYVLGKNMSLPMEFEYGYAITTHRAQGSEWDNVLVIEEGFPFDREEHARWLYTACTRATNRLVIIKND